LLIRDIIVEMADTGKTLVNTHLAGLSDMTPTNIKDFLLVWRTIDPKRRRQIITRLNELETDSVELNFDNVFLSCLTDPDAIVRSESINGLWENEEPALITLLIDLLNNDPVEKVQTTAALALGRFALMAELGTIAPKYAIQVEHVLLGIIGDKNKSIEVRRRALEAVAPLSTEQVKTAIKTTYESHDERLSIGAIYAMGKNCDKKWLPFVIKELKNSDAEMRYEAVTACGEIGDEDIIQYLLPIANDEDIDVHLAVIQAMGKIGGNEARQYLKNNVGDPNEAVRDAIETALNEISIIDDMTVFELKPESDKHEHQR
jgi:HEAT repeat protein